MKSSHCILHPSRTYPFSTQPLQFRCSRQTMHHTLPSSVLGHKHSKFLSSSLLCSASLNRAFSVQHWAAHRSCYLRPSGPACTPSSCSAMHPVGTPCPPPAVGSPTSPITQHYGSIAHLLGIFELPLVSPSDTILIKLEVFKGSRAVRASSSKWSLVARQ